MAVRTTVLASAREIPTGSAQTLYTCPPERTAIVKWWRLVGHPTHNLSSAVVGVRRGGSTYAIRLGPLPAATHVGETEAYLVLEPGDELYVNLTPELVVANLGWFHACGVELAGVAPE